MRSILLGAVIIVVLGVVDDIMALPALLKFVVQIVAALIPALNGVTIQAFSNPNIFSDNAYWVLGNLSIPLTVLWIVAITNSVNLIDGLDGLANGVSAISATTVLVIALIGGQFQVAVVMAALVGACVGFMPYNMNPGPRCSWGTPAPPFWAIFWRPCPSRGCSSSMPSSPLRCPS